MKNFKGPSWSRYSYVRVRFVLSSQVFDSFLKGGYVHHTYGIEDVYAMLMDCFGARSFLWHGYWAQLLHIGEAPSPCGT